MKQIQNDYWLVEVSDDASCITLTDRRNGGVWKTVDPFRMSYGNYYAYNLLERCRVSVESTDDKLSICMDNMKFYGRFPANPYNKPEPAPDLTYRFEFRLEDDEAIGDFIAADPFAQSGIQEYRIRQFSVFQIQEYAKAWTE